MRVLFCATAVQSTNGYSKVAYELLKYLSCKDDIELTHYAFQNFGKNPLHEKERTLPNNIQVYDAYANEKDKKMGFGFEEIKEFVILNKPDLIIIYNDMVVVTNIIMQLQQIPNKNFKLCIYVDQVYQCQKKEHIKILNDYADFVICFSKYWEDCIKEQGMIKPTGIIEHGFSSMLHYPVSQKLARKYYSFDENDFIILNHNRNQPRKRLDLTMMAFAEVISRNRGSNIKLLLGTAPIGCWNLIEIYERELRLRNITLEEGMKHIIISDNPQGLNDTDMNTLINCSDIGINTCSGEGWGLCNFESGAIGIPQIVPKIGGFLDFFDENNSILIDPKVEIYTDMTIDGAPGCCQICCAKDFADAIEKYYNDSELRKEHGKNARARILANYNWNDLGEKIYNYIYKALDKEKSNVTLSNNLVSINDLDDEEDEEKMDLEELLELQNKINKLIKNKKKT